MNMPVVKKNTKLPRDRKRSRDREIERSIFTFEVVFENCKCRSWCRPDDFVFSYTKSGTILMYFSLILIYHE